MPPTRTKPRQVSSVKKMLRSRKLFMRVWGSWRKRQLEHQYVARRDAYAHRAKAKGLKYLQEEAVQEARRRLSSRGYAPTVRELGEIRTFAFIPGISWHDSLIPDLHELGPVVRYDYAKDGYTQQDLYASARKGEDLRSRMNRQAWDALTVAHAEESLDWVFMYATGAEVEVSFIRSIQERLGLPVVNMCLDDKQSWDFPVSRGQNIGQVDIAPHFDLSWTSARIATEWYLCEGGNPILLPEGFDSTLYRPLGTPKDLDITFVGGAYGYRPNVIDELRVHGVNVRTFGDGWDSTFLSSQEQVEVFNRSKINLGMAGIGYSENLKNVKGRDFEVAGTGGGAYLTAFNPDLTDHFSVGNEILCYSTHQEIVELTRYYLARPTLLEELAMRARRRAIADHRWIHRYLSLCSALGICAPG